MVTAVVSGNSDVELERRVVGFLAGRFLPALRRLAIESDSGVVTVRGQVSSFYEKQVALHCCQRVAGVRELIDAVDVESSILASVGAKPVGRD